MAGTEKKTTKKASHLFDGSKPGPGRPKGQPNKTTKLLKEAILEAADKAGGKAGIVGYLLKQAHENPQSFLPLLGKVLPVQVDAAIKHTIEREPLSTDGWVARHSVEAATGATARPN